MSSKLWVGGLAGLLLSVLTWPTSTSQAARKRVVHYESEVAGTLLAVDANGAMVPQPGLTAQLRCVGPEGQDRRFTVTCDSSIVVKRGEQVIAKGSRGLRGVEYRAVAGNSSSVELLLFEAGGGASFLVLRHQESEGDEELRTTQHDQLLVLDGSTVREVYDYESERTWQPGPDANLEMIPPSSLRSVRKLEPDGASNQGAPSIRLYSSSGPEPDQFSLSTILKWDGRMYAVCGTCKATRVAQVRKAAAPSTAGKAASPPSAQAGSSVDKAAPPPTGQAASVAGQTGTAGSAVAVAPKEASPATTSGPGSAAADALSLIDAETKTSIEPLLAQVFKGERLTAESLKRLSQATLTRLRNAPFARHGRPFKSAALQSFFYGARPKEQETPILPRSPNPAYSDALLDESDRANLALILAEARNRTAPTAK